ncbi:hypothetical protein QTP70_005179 [Hemibagrus guttatus]|uniref:Alkylated DNA repair protein AlkB homologue 8 N-terminal domain-containing protein n=1 Tax=Hemibagrus guttatus TaxID=175788 RepID=A0AAE0R9W4_9TELE|nr:hypothetical protein QTP70_005179 [Hemibagrus guttatus]KAK3570561.1 hypothetical protein QTP86_022511 [Hemibagrus guttatus]
MKVIKFANDTTVIGLITGGEKTSYRTEVAGLVAWCLENNLSLNTDKTKEMIIDPRRKRKEQHTPIYISETEVEMVKMFKFLRTYISEDFIWSHNTQQLLRRSWQRLYFLRRLRKFGMSTEILSNFYRCTVESVITNSITVWHGSCTVQDKKALQRVIKTAQFICGAAFQSLQDIYNTRVIRRAHNIIRDNIHPQHNLFTLLPLSSVSWVFHGVSSRWAMPGTPPQGDVQEASETDARATSTVPFRCGGAAALLRAPPR